MRLVRFRPVRWVRGEPAWASAPGVDGDAFPLMEDLDHARREADLDGGLHQREGDAVEMFVDGDVIVDVHPRAPPLGPLIGRGRQRLDAGRSSARNRVRRVPSSFWKGRSLSASRSRASS